jgi:pimeloyl-ACP methyl ester carboxylesterase
MQLKPEPIFHRRIDVDGVEVFYREAGTREAPTLLLLHGFPSASHQFRRLIDALSARFHLVAPDYPGFGHSAAPTPASAGGSFVYSFERLSWVVEGFLERVGLDRFYAYVFDFGAPIALRIATRHPDWFAGLISQNGNTYVEGLSPMIIAPPDETGEEALERHREILTLEVTRGQYETGARDPERVDPDSWTLDQRVLDLPGRDQIMLDLLLDYGSNVELYPIWQAWLREHQPPLLLTWGRNDPFFLEAGATAYLRDVPDAELHLLDTGHFALEEDVADIATLVTEFVERQEDRAATTLAQTEVTEVTS